MSSNREQIAQRRTRSVGIALAVMALFACLMPLTAVLPKLLQGPAVEPTPTPQPTATVSIPAVFRGDVFSFRYPAGWWDMGAAEVNVLLKTSFEASAPQKYSYIGGVFSEGLDNCRECARIVVSVALEPSLPGTLTETRYETFRQASERALGARLLSHQKVVVSSMPAVESIYLSPSGDTQVLELLIVPPQPGLAYWVSCSSHKDSFATFEPVFREAIATMQIAQGAPGSARTPLRPPTPLPTVTPITIVTYRVQPGDVLGQIAKNFGITLEELAVANGIEDTDLIQPGQLLSIPLRAP